MRKASVASPFPEHADPRAVWPPRPLTLLELQVGGRSGLARVRQLRVLRSFPASGNSWKPWLRRRRCVICAFNWRPGPRGRAAGHDAAAPERLEEHRADPELVLAGTVQACIHLLTLGGYGLPLQACCITGEPLDPPLGQWDWRCSLLPQDGFAIDEQPGAAIQLNPSELALLQRLTRADLPRRRDGELMGPPAVWRRLLRIVDIWSQTHLNRPSKALAMLQETLLAGA